MATNDLKQFGDASRKGKDTGDDDNVITVKILEREVELHSPGSGSLAYLAMSVAGAGNDLIQVGQVINFIMSIFDEDDARYVRGLLLDRDSGFDAEDIMDLAIYIVEEWSDRPTKPSTGSSQSRQATGARTTGATRKVTSTPSRSRS
jgi:hypothetical protein